MAGRGVILESKMKNQIMAEAVAIERNVRYEGDIPCITSGLTQKEKGGHQVGRLLY